jgi:hypothetical protein
MEQEVARGADEDEAAETPVSGPMGRSERLEVEEANVQRK